MGSRYTNKTVGPLTYLVRVGRQLRYVHIDHLLRTERVTSEEAFKKVVPEESSVLVSGSSTPPLPASVSVSKTTQDQPGATEKPVAVPKLELPSPVQRQSGPVQGTRP